jgi:hypothetical protein
MSNRIYDQTLFTKVSEILEYADKTLYNDEEEISFDVEIGPWSATIAAYSFEDIVEWLSTRKKGRIDRYFFITETGIQLPQDTTENEYLFVKELHDEILFASNVDELLKFKSVIKALTENEQFKQVLKLVEELVEAAKQDLQNGVNLDYYFENPYKLDYSRDSVFDVAEHIMLILDPDYNTRA